MDEKQLNADLDRIQNSAEELLFALNVISGELIAEINDDLGYNLPLNLGGMGLLPISPVIEIPGMNTFQVSLQTLIDSCNRIRKYKKENPSDHTK